uniref:Uncharacterized protein n=1 Tax=Arundo donax TaxID=35708 RepID=A0A0A9DAH7_ARUDO
MQICSELNKPVDISSQQSILNLIPNGSFLDSSTVPMNSLFYLSSFCQISKKYVVLFYLHVYGH